MSEQAAVGNNSSLRFNAIQRIARQQVRDTLLGWNFYITAAVAVLVAVALVYNSVRFVETSGLNIMTRPFFVPLQVAATIAILYVTIEATLAVARPREQGSLQVLFFAPIDVPAFIAANFVAGVLIYILFLAIIIPPLLLLVLLTNFVVPTALLWGLVPSIVVAGTSIAFGLFISAAAPSVRAAILILVATLILLLLIQVGYSALLSIPPTNRFYDALLFLRVVLRAVQDFLRWFSPFQMMEAVLDASMRADITALLKHIGAATLVTALWLAAAVWALRRKGVLP
jgi:hypothetical protein